MTAINEKAKRMNDPHVLPEKSAVPEYKEWLRYAQMDFNSAEYLSRMPYEPLPLEIICYHCQQSAEKAVKALIVYLGSRGGTPKIHSISFLLNQIKDILKDEYNVIISEDLYDAADMLTPYGIAPRYPSDMEIDYNDMTEALRYAELIVDWVKQLLEESDNISQDNNGN